MRRADGRKLLTLFTSMLSISAFTFGGGFVIITLMKKKFVDGLRWMDEQEMLDLAALAQSSPGAIAVNAAILVGWRVAGPAGMAVAVLGTILPPMLTLSLISLFYAAFAENRHVALLLEGMQAGVAAVILDVVLNLGQGVLRTRSVAHVLVMVAAFAATVLLRVNVVLVLLLCAVPGVLSALAARRRKEGAP